MPRNYGRTATSMWRDEDFLALPKDARWLYNALFNQDNISACGTLELTTRRWMNRTGLTRDEMKAALAILADRRYVVIDEDTEELLVRSFIGWDGGLKNETRLKAILDSARAIASPQLRAVMAHELARHGIHDALPGTPPDSPPHGPTDAPSDGLRVVVTERNHLSNPQPTTLNPQPGEGEPTAREAASPRCSKHPDGPDHDEPCHDCRRVREWLAAEPARRSAARKAEADASKRAIGECPDCDHQGQFEDDDGVMHRCDHKRLRAVSA